MNGNYVTWDFRTAVTSFHWRIAHWYYLLSRATEQPFFGFGPGQAGSYNPFRLDAHSQFVQIFFDEGLLGLCIYIMFWFSIPIAVVSAYRVEANSHRRKSNDADIRNIWMITFAAVTLAATFSFGFSMATLAYSHLIVSIFVAMSCQSQTKAAPYGRLMLVRALRAHADI